MERIARLLPGATMILALSAVLVTVGCSGESTDGDTPSGLGITTDGGSID